MKADKKRLIYICSFMALLAGLVILLNMHVQKLLLAIITASFDWLMNSASIVDSL